MASLPEVVAANAEELVDDSIVRHKVQLGVAALIDAHRPPDFIVA